MSTQVLRRRNTAAITNANAGAPGEITVATDTVRAHVHDGATLGGRPVAGIPDMPGQSVAINGSFAINQRAYTSGTALAAGVYAHDRFKAGTGGCTYTFTQAVPDTTITITAGSLAQVVEASNIYAGSYWLSWPGTATARVYQGTAGSYSAGTTYTDPIYGTRNKLLVSGLTVGTQTTIEFSTGTIACAAGGPIQFEAALSGVNVPTCVQRRHLGQELALCQRYYFSRIPTTTDYFELIANGQVYLGYGIDLPAVMRATPTVTVTATTSGTFASGNPSVQSASPGRLYLRGDTTLGSYTALTSVIATAEL